MGETLDNVRELAPMIAASAETVEKERALPADLLEALRRAGVFRMYVPRSHGGDELPPLEAVQVVEAISRADASVGWLAAIGASTPAIMAHVPVETYDKLYAAGPDVIGAGSLVPRGRAVAVDGGYRFTGRWPFASGCRHAEYLVFAAFVERPPDDGGGGDGTPTAADMRFGVVPAGEIEIIDTWHVAGLKGTGSHDLEAKDLFVPEEWTGSLLAPPPLVRHPLDVVRPLGRLGLEIAAVALGTAQGAIDDLVAIGRTKKPLGGLMKRRAEDHAFQHRLGELDLDARTARILCYEVARADYERVTTGGELSQQGLIERRTVLTRVGDIATTVVGGCFHESGTTGLFEDSPLQRRLRDAHAVVQHILFTADALTAAGATLLGEPIDGYLLF